jgi:cytochrome c2
VLVASFAVLAAAACSSSTASPTSAPAAAKPAAAPAPNPTAVAEGAALIQQKGCPGCHTIPGIPGANGTVGPNLGGVASRPTLAGGAVQNNGPDDIKKWILDPPAIKPGTQMPKLGLTDDEATRIVAYLETLK